MSIIFFEVFKALRSKRAVLPAWVLSHPCLERWRWSKNGKF